MILSTILAQAAQQQMQPNPQGELVRMLGMFAMLGVMFYFLLIRPQQKRARELAELLKSIKPGDKILTSSGIIGKVVHVSEKEKTPTVTIRSADSKLEISKGAITEVVERAGATSES